MTSTTSELVDDWFERAVTRVSSGVTPTVALEEEGRSYDDLHRRTFVPNSAESFDWVRSLRVGGHLADEPWGKSQTMLIKRPTPRHTVRTGNA